MVVGSVEGGLEGRGVVSVVPLGDVGPARLEIPSRGVVVLNELLERRETVAFDVGPTLTELGVQVGGRKDGTNHRGGQSDQQPEGFEHRPRVEVDKTCSFEVRATSQWNLFGDIGKA